MTYNIYTTHTLSQIQTISALILSILGIGWFFFLSNAVKFRTIRILSFQTNNDDNGEVSILETIVPTTVADVFRTLSIKITKPIVFISAMVIIGLVLTSFEGIIVINTVYNVESCKVTTVVSQAQITNDNHEEASSTYFEVEEMMRKRNKSGVPEGVLVGQIPMDDCWKFNARFDVDPYSCRSSCSLYGSGLIQVNMNYSEIDLRASFPEVHAEYKFRNSPDGFNFTRDSYATDFYWNRTKGTTTYWANGLILTLVEEFTQGSFDAIGNKYINRIWTFKVPETIKMAYDPKHTIIGVISVPMFVKAYTCEVERVKEGSYGSYNLLNQDLDIATTVMSGNILRKMTLAIINGKDTSIYELTPEIWASYLAVKDTQTAQVVEVPVQIDLSCISVHAAYILLVCMYIIMVITGFICWVITFRKLEIPNGVIGWVSQACIEASDNDNIDNNEYNEYKLFDYNLIANDDDIKIIPRNESEIITLKE